MEQAHQQFLERVTDMLRHCAIEVDSLVKFADGVDTTMIPGITWPFSFPPVAPEYRNQDSLRNELMASLNDGAFSTGALLATYRAAFGHYAPTAQRPAYLLMCSLDHSVRSRVGGSDARKRAQSYASFEGLTNDSMIVSYSLSYTDDLQQCDTVWSCSLTELDYSLYLQGWFATRSSDVIGEPRGYIPVLSALIRETARFNRPRIEFSSTWELHGHLLPDYRAILEITHDDFTSTDTVSFAPSVP